MNNHIVYPDNEIRMEAINKEIVDNNTKFDDLFEMAQQEYKA